MKVTLTSTTLMTTVNGTKARVWEGTTDSGIKVYAAIAMIAHHKDDDHRAAEFRRDLDEQQEPTPAALRCFDPRLVM